MNEARGLAMTRRALITLLLAPCLLASGCSGTGLTHDSFDAIEDGMKAAEVESRLGAPTRKGGDIDAGRVSEDVETWVWEKDGDTIATVTFVGGKVRGKKWFGR